MEEYIFELELQWQKEFPQRNTGKEILETMTYAEAKELLEPLLINRIINKQTFAKQYKRIKRLVKKTHAPDTFEYDFSIDALWILHRAKDDIKNQQELAALEAHWRFNEARKPESKTSDYPPYISLESLREIARQVVIEKLYQGTLRRSGSHRLTGKCPFHTEKTGSFTIFTDSNSFYCFGCNAFGDSITFYQKLYCVNFKEAVQALAQY